MTHRDNGLPATSYVRMRDVETHLVEGLLDRLQDAEVAAYVEPAPGKRGPYGDTVLPVSPTDSVYVDANRLSEARVVCEGYLAEVAADELAWAGIVAAFEAPSVDEVPRWPAAEDIDEPDGASGTEAGGLRSARAVRPADLPPAGFGELRDALTPEPVPVPAYDAARDDHFEPPPPPPVPMPDTIGRFAWAAVIFGPLFLVISALFSLDVSGWPGFLALAASVGGFVTLVARMKDRPDSDLGDDDGAVV
jgi:hypothetical protein